MANSKKFVVKNGLETQNIQFVEVDGTQTITLTVLDDGTLSFTGTSGQLFSISDSLTGTIFSVNDISGIPSIEVFDDGKVVLAESTGNVGIGTATPTEKLEVSGTIKATGLTLTGGLTVGGDFTVNGTTTNINTTNLVVEDKNIIIGDVATPSDITADGGGITLKGATDKTITWVDSTDRWTSNQVFSAPNYVSTVATGTQPYAATSTTVNTNLNTDLLDGYHETSFLRLAPNSSTATNGNFAIGNASSRNFIQTHNSQPLDINPLGNTVTIGGTSNTAWHAGNDGASSGLDADLLDGQHGSYYLDTSSTAQTKTGNLAISSTTTSGQTFSVVNNSYTGTSNSGMVEISSTSTTRANDTSLLKMSSSGSASNYSIGLNLIMSNTGDQRGIFQTLSGTRYSTGIDTDITTNTSNYGTYFGHLININTSNYISSETAGVIVDLAGGSGYSRGFVVSAGATLNGSYVAGIYSDVYTGASNATGTAYGIYSSLFDNGSTTDTYSIYSASGKNYFAGNTGFNTALPPYLISLNTSSNDNGIQIRRNSIATNDYAALNFRISTAESTTNHAQITAIRTNRAVAQDTDIAFATFSNNAFAERVRIRDDGNVGIGISNPTEKLDVNGNIKGTQFNGLTLTAGTTGFTIAGGTTSKTLTLQHASLTVGDATGTGSVTIKSSGVAARNLTLTGDSNINALTSGHVVYASAANTISGEAQLAISRGGTNTNATPTNGGVAYGTGSAYAFSTVGTADDILVSNGAGAPSFRKVFYSAVSNTGTGSLDTDVNTNWVSLFQFTSLPIGKYYFKIIGGWRRSGTTTSRSLSMSIFGSATTYSIEATAIRDNTTNSATGNAAQISRIFAASNTAGGTNSFWSSSSANTAVSNAPFEIIGYIDITTSITLNVQFRQTAGASVDIVGILDGTTMELVRYA